MTTVKLTRGIRESIRNDMLRHRFSSEFRELVAERKAVAHAILRHVIPEDVLRRAADLPEGWLPNLHQFHVKIAGSFTELHLSGGGLYGDILKAQPSDFKYDRAGIPVPAKYDHRSALGILDRAGSQDELQLVTWHERVESETSDLTKRVREAMKIADGVLARASTLNRLRELWPEAAPFTKRHEVGAPALPAVPTEELNKLFDLPVGEAA